MNSQKWLQKLSKKARNNAPIMRGSKLGFSRKMEGQYSYKGEIHAYPEVVLYMQKGLGGTLPEMKKMIRKISWVQSEYDPYVLSCFVFGIKPDKLSHTGKIFEIFEGGGRRAVKKMCELAGTELSEGKDPLPVLYPPSNIYRSKAGAGKEDLLIFICRDKNSVDISDNVCKKLKLRSRKYTFWIYINEGEDIECETHRERIMRINSY